MGAWMKSRNARDGSVYAMVILAMVALVGMAAFSMDVGRAVLAAQRAQEVADAAAIAAASGPINQVSSTTMGRIDGIVSANNAAGNFAVNWASSGVTLFTGGQTVLGYGLLNSYEEAVRVTTQVPVKYHFAPMLGIAGTTVTRQATAVRTFALGSPICPMWISYSTNLQYGVQQSLLMASAPHYANIPGNFGFLCPVSGTNDFQTLLCGYNCSPALIIANYVTVGQIVMGQTGLATGQWESALATASDGTARMQRAAVSPWSSDNFSTYHKDNPRILIIPMCEFLDGTGSNARFVIRKFGAFWLDSVQTTGQKGITGRFIQYQLPGAMGDSLGEDTGLWQAKLVR